MGNEPRKVHVTYRMSEELDKRIRDIQGAFPEVYGVKTSQIEIVESVLRGRRTLDDYERDITRARKTKKE